MKKILVHAGNSSYLQAGSLCYDIFKQVLMAKLRFSPRHDKGLLRKIFPGEFINE